MSANNSTTTQTNFPQIRKITIEYFSLYKLIDKINIDLKNGVFCLAGANGLGKSTFISIVHYGLTGIVINPRKNFTSINQISKFFKDNRDFADDYFDGRIQEKDRDKASITIVFVLNEFEYTIKRNFFEPDELQEFLKKDLNGNLVFDSSEKLPKELNGLYQHNLKSDLKFESFEQFSFLLFFLFTFDEARKLLFWDLSVLSRILHLVFGMDAAKAEKSDFLKKEIARHESNMRNMQNAIQKDEKALSNLIQNLNKSEEANSQNVDEILSSHETLLSYRSQVLENLESCSVNLSECELKITDYSSQISVLKKQYDDIFEDQFDQKTIEKDPRIIDLLRELERVLIKGNGNGEIQFEKIKEIIFENHKRIDLLNQPVIFEQLQAIDKQLFDLKAQLTESLHRRDRLENDKKELNILLVKTHDEILQFEILHKEALEQISKSEDNDSMKRLIQTYQELINEKKKDKASEELKRNSLQIELGELEKELSTKYALVEEQFIPIFSKYANSFLGLDVSITPQRNINGFSLNLAVDNNGRPQNYQLSESQRYFIDIALRMALIEHWCNGGTMLIDTPEGSLDVAYESKAGKMFADFALKGYDIIMTANINTSQLLIQMAASCRKDKMQLERMTTWTTLSQVQEDEKPKINGAYTAIELELNRISNES